MERRLDCHNEEQGFAGRAPAASPGATNCAMVRIRTAQPKDHAALLALRQALWPDVPAQTHGYEITALLTREPLGPYPTRAWVAETDDGVLAGFVEAGLRSHADGCDPARPVGYLEGWYVAEKWRRKGVGRALVEAAETWARALGCREMASDTWIGAEVSLRAHASLGYEVVDRCVNFRKTL